MNSYVGAFRSGTGEQLGPQDGETHETLNPFGTGSLRIDTSVPTVPSSKKP